MTELTLTIAGIVYELVKRGRKWHVTAAHSWSHDQRNPEQFVGMTLREGDNPSGWPLPHARSIQKGVNLATQ